MYRSLPPIPTRTGLRLAGLALALWLAAPAGLSAQQAERYLSEVPDLPLMDGLEEAQSAGLAFDKPEGRIVEAFASGAVPAAEVSAFYARTLPQLGWRAEGEESYRRESEILTLSYSGDAGQTTVRFSLRPE